MKSSVLHRLTAHMTSSGMLRNEMGTVQQVCTISLHRQCSALMNYNYMTPIVILHGVMSIYTKKARSQS
jgi:hypothetical protein